MAMCEELPKFPITVVFLEDDEKWVLENEQEAACNLEWFDSRDSDEHVRVTDRLGRSVRLVVEKLDVKLCQLE